MRFLREQQNLNQVERWKLERHPLDVHQAIIDRYASEGPDAIASVPGEMERLKWVGLYPQRQGGDAFMMRIKLPGGRLDAAQARVIGQIATEHARGPTPNPLFGQGFLDLTTRQDIQLHWVKIGAVPEIWRRLEEVGVVTIQACGDSARNVLCCPVSGLDADEVVEAYPVARAISGFFTGNREYANLPRKFKMSVTGCREDCAQAEINDIGLWPARLDDGTVGFNALVGGGLSDGPRTSTCSSTRSRRSSSPAPSRRSSASWATARTAGPAGCATWCRNSAPSASARSCRRAPPSSSPRRGRR
jgi:ferredoxin-nitrite reductase